MININSHDQHNETPGQFHCIELIIQEDNPANMYSLLRVLREAISAISQQSKRESTSAREPVYSDSHK
jgi:hypothetical protein